MAAEDEEPREGQEETGGAARRSVAALVALGVVAAGVGVALGTKAVLGARRKGTPVSEKLPVVGKGSGDGGGASEDLPTVLRRAALDVALAATSEAADRLGSSPKR